MVYLKNKIVKLCIFILSLLIEVRADEITRNRNITTNLNTCICIPYNKCYQETLDKGGKASDVRIYDISCKNNLDVCCETSDETNLINHKSKGCGFRNPEGVGIRRPGNNITNEAYLGEFPWMVTILIEVIVKGRKQNIYLCGGSLIHPRVVLTAAHCISNKSLKIRAGEWDTQVKNEHFEHQDRFVKTVIIHPEYNPNTYANDVALLILSEEVDIAEHVDIVCLPLQDAVIDNTRCFASGWGKDVFGRVGKYQAILKRTDLPIVNKDLCQERLRSTRLGKKFELDHSFICAGGEDGKDTCTGDGGSPLVCPILGQSNRYVQAGIVAWGIGCGENQIPGVYVNVAMFRNWINRQIVYNNLETSFYQHF